jgi:Kef-type K+ transport system membrane component KefB
VSLWIETAIIMAAALWLLLFVAPALFNAHTSIGLWLSIFLFMLALLALAATLTRILRALHATGRKDDGI